VIKLLKRGNLYQVQNDSICFEPVEVIERGTTLLYLESEKIAIPTGFKTKNLYYHKFLGPNGTKITFLFEHFDGIFSFLGPLNNSYENN